MTGRAPRGIQARGRPLSGDFRSARGHQTFEVRSPLDGLVVGLAPDLGADATEEAIRKASEALVSWKAVSATARAAILHRWAQLVVQRKAPLAELINREQGKSRYQAEAEVSYGAGFIDWYAEEAKRVQGRVIAPAITTQRILSLREPIGVCAAITPWNYPLAMVARKIAPAVAAGCAVVLKPAEQTPLTALALADLAIDAGLPQGVLNIVTAQDPRPVGDVLSASPIVRHLSFTGSATVGKQLLAKAASTVKKCTLELGGNAPFLVFDDADLERAADALIASKFRNSGQTCVCPNRVIVARKVYQQFITTVIERVARLVVSDDSSERFDVGPLISVQAAERIRALLADALTRGATIRWPEGSAAMEANRLAGSNRFHPVVIDRVLPSMRVWNEEIFGPLLAFAAFDSEEEAIELANGTPYGLAAYFFTREWARGVRVAEQLQFGMVGVNDIAISQEIVPFGGIKESGLGREASHLGIDEYLEFKTVCTGFS